MRCPLFPSNRRTARGGTSVAAKATGRPAEGRMTRRWHVGGMATAVMLGCGSSDMATLSEREAAPPSAVGDESGGAAAPGEPPQEKEVESDYEAPVATGKYVWIANPK